MMSKLKKLLSSKSQILLLASILVFIVITPVSAYNLGKTSQTNDKQVEEQTMKDKEQLTEQTKKVTEPNTTPQQATKPSTYSPPPTNKCDNDAMTRADQKYDQALLANGQELKVRLSTISSEMRQPGISVERSSELLALQDKYNTEKLEKDRQAWNTHVRELEQAGCSRGQRLE